MPSSSDIYFEGVGASNFEVKAVHLVQLMRVKFGIRDFNWDDKVISVVEVSRIPIMGHNFCFRRGNPDVLSHDYFPKLAIHFPQLRELLFELLMTQSKALIHIVEPHLQQKYQVPVVVGKKEVVMFAAGGMVGN